MTILRSKRLAIIGVGNIGRILLGRLILAGMPADHLVICDSDETRIRHYISLTEIPGLLIDGVLASVRETPAHKTLVEWLSGVSVPGAK